MKKNILKILVLFFLPCCYTACNNNEDNSEDVENIMSREDSLDVEADVICHNLCFNADTTTFIQENYEPTYGRAIYEVTPTVRYKVAHDLDDAKNLFLMLIGENQMSGDEMTLDLGSNGYLHFKANNNADSYAEVDVALTKIPNLKKIIYIDEKLWPNNQGDANISEGNFLKRKEANVWKYYVCIRNCVSDDGLLMTFDVGRNEITDIQDQHNWVMHYTFIGFSLPDDIRALSYWMHDADGNFVADDLIRILPDSKLLTSLKKPSQQKNSLYTDPLYFLTGGVANYSTSGGTYDYKKHKYVHSGKETDNRHKYIYLQNEITTMYPRNKVTAKWDGYNSYEEDKHWVYLDQYTYLRTKCIRYNEKFNYENEGFIMVDFDEKRNN